MARHAAPRHSRLPAGLVRVLHNAAPPLALLVVVGVIVWLSPSLHDTAEPAGSSIGAARPSPSSSPSATSGPEPSRHGTRLTSQAGVVPGIVLRKLPEIPHSWVRVRRGPTLATSFTSASYNLLGYSHTVRGGDKAGYADGHTRMRIAVGQLRAQGVSVAGFQEFQMPQAYTFAAASPGWSAYPGTSGDNRSVQNSIVWDTSVWDLVETRTTSIPYFSGTRIPMPYVLLQHRATGQRVWFANFHNPADKFGSAERWRDLATSIEVALVNQLSQDHPVVMTGDMNEREEFLCRVATGASMHSADGGYVDSSGCHSPTPTKVDWIVGTSGLQFSAYAAIDSRVSDHPLLRSGATIAPQVSAARCKHKDSAPRDVLFCPPTAVSD
jgi:hypothetical protein